MKNRRSLAVLGVCAGAAGVAATTPAGTLADTATSSGAPAATTAPARPPGMPPSPLLVARAVAEKATSLGRKRLGATYACVDVFERDARRPRVVLRVTTARSRPAARKVLQDARAAVGITSDLTVKLPRLTVEAIDRRLAFRTLTTISERLQRESRRWITAGSPTIPGINPPSGCEPITIVLEAAHTPDQLTWAQQQQQRYGTDRIALQIHTGNEPAPVPTA
ncbi:hypothetical protein [Conexibacter sp. CPCC 206217]|uniref:hypothetical protein n=1 Tax=Conexibacter sp. CPCC 206217 TaxID=3064574 RepID=UPI002720683C|nr:hypothetical protein [Conexibacter sp. CPCC 206217]MDO8210650.1 hypothetical protein [Conexibacter sp. CPCC 206217]